MIVVSDTTPINYLVLIGEVDLLPVLYTEIIIPLSVLQELQSVRAPKPVREFAMALPDWVRVRSHVPVPGNMQALGAGERQAILLAMELAPAVLLTDDRSARRVAAMYSVATISTLRVLADASEAGEIDLEKAFLKLRATNFRVEDDILRKFLKDDAVRKGTLQP